MAGVLLHLAMGDPEKTDPMNTAYSASFKKAYTLGLLLPDIAKIYQRWSNVDTIHRSPWWHLRIVTNDGKDMLLASVPYRHSDENFVEFVLPVIIEIRSRNSQIVIEK